MLFFFVSYFVQKLTISRITWSPPQSQVFFVNPDVDILVVTALEIFDDGVQIPVGMLGII